MRSFYFYEAGGPQDRNAAAIVHSGKEAVAVTMKLGDGIYNVRDCLGGLLFRLQIKGPVMTRLPLEH